LEGYRNDERNVSEKKRKRRRHDERREEKMELKMGEGDV
jgi:hypothetical protein